MEKRHLVLLEQVEDALVVLLDHFVLAAQHPGHVHRHLTGADAMLGKMLPGMVEMFARLQQGLRRDAADIGASATWRRATRSVLPLVDAGHRETQLRRADRRDIAARTTADDDDVELFGAHDFPKLFSKLALSAANGPVAQACGRPS